MTRSEYQTYLASREWALKREQVRARADDKCERCHVAKMEAVHHLTYERIGDELLTDLMAICTACHEFLSGKTDIDPRHAFHPEVQFESATVPYFSALSCPYCGSLNLHQCRVDVFNRPGGEDTPSVATVIHHHDESKNWTEAENPSWRRQGIIIYFWCEGCCAGYPVNHKPAPPDFWREQDYELPLGLAVLQHKGSTYIVWVNTKTNPRTVFAERLPPEELEQ